MRRQVLESTEAATRVAAEYAAAAIREAILTRGHSRVVAATGTTQIRFLELLTEAGDIEWPRVELFHLDEFVGLGSDHPASFARFIHERIVERTSIQKVHYLNGLANPEEECKRMEDSIGSDIIDITFTGLGENGHLAFNEPPADFTTSSAYLVVGLTDTTRSRQVEDLCFSGIDQVPKQAITMSIPQILKSRSVLCLATGRRKTPAIERCFAGAITPQAPASALQMHPNAVLFLDRDAAARSVRPM